MAMNALLYYKTEWEFQDFQKGHCNCGFGDTVRDTGTSRGHQKPEGHLKGTPKARGTPKRDAPRPGGTREGPKTYL